ncbi:hypothetical protein DLM75_10360 [Leptospira stimsonii]|uniref:Uncharacterized protein n=1 Tax=Leptospira stimsonii TaxID=2202203 RepID=A0A396ZAQ3_9LEPT|nr:hypothetical protein DLM75_10360 [Leptospira stimsonii]
MSQIVRGGCKKRTMFVIILQPTSPLLCLGSAGSSKGDFLTKWNETFYIPDFLLCFGLIASYRRTPLEFSNSALYRNRENEG